MVAPAKKSSQKTPSSEKRRLSEKLEAGIASLRAGRVVTKPEYERMTSEIIRKPATKGTRTAR